MIFNLEMNPQSTNKFKQDIFSQTNVLYEILSQNKNVNINSSIRKYLYEDSKKKGSNRNVNIEKPKQTIKSNFGFPTSPSYTSREACSRSFPNFQGSPLQEPMTPVYKKVRRFSQGSEQHSTSSHKHSYAGAKFNDAPAPHALPLPPLHWLPPTQLPSHLLNKQPYNIIATQHLKSMLQIKA